MPHWCLCSATGGIEANAALQVAIALSLLTAAVAKPPFNQLICTFSATPELHLVKGDTLVKQVDVTGAQQSNACHSSVHGRRS